MRPTACLFSSVIAMVLCSLVQAQDKFTQNWGGGPKPYFISLDQTIKLSGKYSGLLERRSISNKDAAFGTFVQNFSAEEYVGKRLRYSAYVKTQNVSGHAALWLRVDSKELGTVAFDDMEDRPVTGTTDWYKYEIVLDVPKGSTAITFGALLHGNGKIWIDDVSIDAVNDEIPVTQGPMTPTGKAVTLPENLPKQPSNLAFESAFVQFIKPDSTE